jgi:hypothetical protein
MSTPIEHLDKWKLIQQIDLRSVRQKFLERKNWWWNASTRADKAEAAYRQFLYLMAVNVRMVKIAALLKKILLRVVRLKKATGIATKTQTRTSLWHNTG